MKKVYASATCVDHRKAERALAHKLARDYDRSIDGSTVEVGFDCDPLTGRLEELVLERGAGHGGNLEIWRIARTHDRAEFEVIGIAYQGFFSSVRRAGLHARVGRGRIAEQALEQALATARPALTARVRELEPPPRTNGASLGKISGSSGNFHLYFRLTDGLHELVRHFTGYPGTDTQARYLGLEEAHSVLAPLLAPIPLEAVAPGEEEREVFVESFLRAAPRFDDEFAWWVRDRYVALAEHFGTRELVPTLVVVLERGLREAEREQDTEQRRSTAERRLGPALGALARITGWDPRKDETGVARDPLEVAREVIEECRVDGEAGSKPREQDE